MGDGVRNLLRTTTRGEVSAVYTASQVRHSTSPLGARLVPLQVVLLEVAAAVTEVLLIVID